MSLMCHGGDTGSRTDDVMIEYTGEGLYAPAFVLRQDRLKYVHCRTDPPLFFDLKKDPDERKNVADDPGYTEAVKRLQSEIGRRWDYERLERDILVSRKRWLFVQQALLNGHWTGWDHQPCVDSTRAHVRGADDPNTMATRARRRLPFVGEVDPDHPRHCKPAIDLKPI
jgi:choline-sulfatase